MRIPNHSFALSVALLVGLMASPTPACLPDCNDPVAGFSSWPSTEWEGFYVIAVDTWPTLNAQWPFSYDDELPLRDWVWSVLPLIDDGVMAFADPPNPPDYGSICWPTVGIRTVKLQVTDRDSDICNEYGCCEDHSAEAEHDYIVVKVEKLQYLPQGASEYVDVPSVLYVAKGSTLTFKAIVTFSIPVWPYGKPQWSGSSGATGTGTWEDVV